ncbi:MAG: ribonuclease J, partial [Armatimonadota bacterium]
MAVSSEVASDRSAAHPKEDLLLRYPVPVSIVQVIPLGGVGEIGKNCTVVRQGDDIVVIDCGLSFPNEEQPGVDIVVPDFTYLRENRDKIRGVFITHAHEDHVGGLPYLLEEFDVDLWVTEFTHSLIRQKIEERIPSRKVRFKIYKPGDKIAAGALEIEPVRITHSIPDSMAMAVRTRLGELGQEGVVLLLSDSTNVDRAGWGPSERSVIEGLRSVFSTAPGRILLTTFASNIHRLQQACEVAAEYGRKVAVVGRRMEQNLDICERMGYIKLPKGVRIDLRDLEYHQDSDVAILTTGSQGEPMSALVQMSKGEYGRLQIKPGDTLIYSARPIPGNEGGIWRTINRLFEQGCRVIYDSRVPIHVSGHAYQEELKMMINLTKPYYLAPVHGEPRHQFAYNEIATAMGYPDHRLFTLSNGQSLDLDEKAGQIKNGIPVGSILVDSSGRAGVTDEVLRDRNNLANDGLIIVTVAVDRSRGEILGPPTIVARGFVGADGAIPQAEKMLKDSLGSLSKADFKDSGKV